MVINVRRELVEWQEEGKDVEGIIMRKVKYGNGSIKVVKVYINRDMEKNRGDKEMDGREGRWDKNNN